MRYKLLFWVVFLLLGGRIFAQNSLQVENNQAVIKAQEIRKITWNTDPLSPSKAAFYSAVLPGLGQIYNKSYWKVPIVWGAIGVGVYAYIWNDKKHTAYRTAYKRRLDGFTDDEFFGNSPTGNPRINEEGLRRAQKHFQRQKEMSLLITIGLYALNIIEANVDAHLKQYNVDDRLALQPFMRIDEVTNVPQYGLTFQMKF